MNQRTQLWLAEDFVLKSAATAPASLGDTGKSLMGSLTGGNDSTIGTPSPATAIHQTNTAVQQNPLAAAAVNPVAAPAGTLANLGSKLNTPMATMLHSWQQNQRENSGKALS